MIGQQLKKSSFGKEVFSYELLLNKKLNDLAVPLLICVIRTQYEKQENPTQSFPSIAVHPQFLLPECPSKQKRIKKEKKQMVKVVAIKEYLFLPGLSTKVKAQPYIPNALSLHFNF